MAEVFNLRIKRALTMRGALMQQGFGHNHPQTMGCFSFSFGILIHAMIMLNGWISWRLHVKIF